jgi:ADP-ribose pyrophosphatase YjhB (NUDIX family)
MAGAVAYRFCPACGGPLAPRSLKPGEPDRLVCAACGFVFYLDPKVAAGTICTVDGGIVLLRRAIEPRMGKWVFPGGFVDRGEAVRDAAVRETWEEARLRVRLREILDAYSFAGQDVVVVVYAADVVDGRPEAGDESAELRLFPPESIPWGDLAFDSTRAALRDYVRRYCPGVEVPA